MSLYCKSANTTPVKLHHLKGDFETDWKPSLDEGGDDHYLLPLDLKTASLGKENTQITNESNQTTI